MLTAAKQLRIWTARELQECAEREVNIRRRVYANRVLTHRMTQHQADVEIARMEAIARMLAEMAEGERLL
jgi:hypothetical protein